MLSLQKIWWSLCRRKTFVAGEKERLNRVLGLVDLISLGVGSTLGLGVYILAGSVAHDYAGPSVCLSFLVAAFASALAGICYSEFASRVPAAGSAYIYSYVSVGEFIAFSIGWNLILEYVIGTASVAKGLSTYIDALVGNKISDAFTEAVPIDVNYLSSYADFLSFAFVMVITVLLVIGVKDSTRLNNFFTLLNLITITIVIVAGAIKANPGNWFIPLDEIDEADKPKAGAGGFFPWGFAGVMKGAATCFFGFVGFDCVATTGEEAKNPKKNIPRSIVISLLVIFLAYFSIAIVLTMMVPYYLQDPNAPFPYAFNKVGLPVISYIVSGGAICALCTSLFGAMFPLPRVVYSMASDKLIPHVLSHVNAKTFIPDVATIFCGLLAGVMAMLFDLSHLIEMMSIGTLMAYTIVAISILMLRFEPEDKIPTMDNFENPHRRIWKSILNLNGTKISDSLTSSISNISIFLYILVSLLLCGTAQWWGYESDLQIGLMMFLGVVLIVALIVLLRQPHKSLENLVFKVPFVPILPCLSILVNLYLMVNLQSNTWIRFIIWLTLGYIIYFIYGIRFSTERIQSEKQQNGDLSKNVIEIKTKM